MKLSPKSLVAAVAFALLGASGGAHAAALPQDVFVEVYDPTSQYYFIDDLGAAPFTSGPTSNISLTSANGWSTFLGDATGPASNFQFFIFGSNILGQGNITDAIGGSSFTGGGGSDMSNIQSADSQFFANAANSATPVSNSTTANWAFGPLTGDGSFGTADGDAVLNATTGGQFTLVNANGEQSLATVTLVNGVLDFSTATMSATPEPGTYALMIAGLLAVGTMARRRTRA